MEIFMTRQNREIRKKISGKIKKEKEVTGNLGLYL
jgi:hypothetical protein